MNSSSSSLIHLVIYILLCIMKNGVNFTQKITLYKLTLINLHWLLMVVGYND